MLISDIIQQRDEDVVIPVGSHHPRYQTTLSLPSIVGPYGGMEVLWPAMSDVELAGLNLSADEIRPITGKYLG
jgi:hypothetical protein